MRQKMAYYDQLAAAIQHERQVAALAQAVVARAEQFRKQNPDFDSAVEHVRRPMVNYLKQQGLSESEARVRTEQVLDQELIHYAANGIDPVERVYQVAKIRGYTSESNGKERHISKEEAEAKINEVLSKGNNATDEEIDEAVNLMDRGKAGTKDKWERAVELASERIDSADDDGLSKILDTMRKADAREKKTSNGAEVGSEKVDKILESDEPLEKRMEKAAEVLGDTNEA